MQTIFVTRSTRFRYRTGEILPSSVNGRTWRAPRRIHHKAHRLLALLISRLRVAKEEKRRRRRRSQNDQTMKRGGGEKKKQTEKQTRKGERKITMRGGRPG